MKLSSYKNLHENNKKIKPKFEKEIDKTRSRIKGYTSILLNLGADDGSNNNLTH